MTAPEHSHNPGIPLDLENKLTPYNSEEITSYETVPDGLDPLFGLSVDEEGDLFSHPKNKNIIQKHVGDNYISEQEALASIQQWKDNALNQGKCSDNTDKVVLSLFDLSGKWAEPWAEAGYDVYCIDIQNGMDINDFSVEYLMNQFDFCDVYAILAACPCTEFASSGSRHFKAKDEDGRTEAAKNLVFQTIRTIEFYRPTIWAIENPVGRIENLTGLPNARMTFHPHHFGDDYTKKTILWGRFNEDLPTANRPPTEGSKMHRLYGGKSIETKNARSATPEGFSYSFFQANNHMDMPLEKRLGFEYPELRGAVLTALNEGLNEEEIVTSIRDLYLDDEIDEARESLADLILGGQSLR
jgi:hypothetical protein